MREVSGPGRLVCLSPLILLHKYLKNIFKATMLLKLAENRKTTNQILTHWTVYKLLKIITHFI